MKIDEYIPTEQLRPYIKAYRIIESSDEIVNRVVPNTSFAMAFRIRGQISYLNDSDKTVVADGHTTGERVHLKAEKVIEHYNWVWQHMIATKGKIEVKNFEQIKNDVTNN